jgi:Peptidase family M28
VAWANSSAKTLSWKSVYSLNEESVTAILLALFLLLTATFSIREQDPPAALSAAAPPDQFSAGRAAKHLPVIADHPHPRGTVQHQKVRDYLMSQLAANGVEAQVQQSMLALGQGPPVVMGTVQNVLGRLRGTAGTGKAVLLVAHYDSLVNSFGATDNGSSVATLLETLRAIKSGPPLKDDVIFLFSDGEEDGMLGARVFVAEHPWAEDVGLVLNFDARGNTGPVMMFEATDRNGWLVSQLAQASAFPVTHSLSYELYRLLPNDTDLSVFKRVGMPGLNFATIDGINRYHDPLDNLQGVDQNSLQHRGSYALGLTRQFGNQDLSQTRERNAVFFDLFGRYLAHYSSMWVLPLLLLITVLFVALLVLGFKRKRIAIPGIVRGFVSLLLSMVVASLLGWLLWKGFWLVRPGPSATATQSRLLFAGFVTLALATTLGVFAFMRKRSQVESLAVGALLWWLLFALAASVLLPGASFVFQWPLLFSLIGLGWMIMSPETEKRSRWLNPVVLGLCAVPGMILMAPIVYQMFIGLTLTFVVLIMLMVVLLFGFLLPQLQLIASPFKWFVPGAAAVAAIVLLVVGVVANSGGLDKPGNTILYGLNTDTGKAIWASDLAQRDDRSSQFFASTQEKGTIEDFAYARKSKQYTLNQAPAAQLPAPQMSVLEDKSQDGVRTLKLRLTSPRQAGMVAFYLDSNAEILNASVDGVSASDDSQARSPWGIQINGFPQQGVELQLQLRTADPVKFRLVDQSYGLPPVTPAAQAQADSVFTKPDMTLLVKSYSL